MRLAWILFAAGCGRFGFDARADGHGALDAPPDTIVETGLVAWYRMEAVEDLGLGGNSYGIRDATGAGHTAECTQLGMMLGAVPNSCPISDAGHDGSSLAFNGTSDVALVVDSADLHTTSAFTVAAWVQLDAYAPAGNAACIATKRLGNTVFNSWALCYLENGNVYFYTVAGGVADKLTTPGALPLAEWHHVAILWDGAHKQILFDAVVVASDNDATIDWDALPVYIGADADNGMTVAYAQAHIDEVRIYNRALSTDELMQLAQ